MLTIPVPARVGIVGVPPTVCSTFERSEVVFRGRVVSIEPIQPPASAGGATPHVIDGDTVRDLALNGQKYLELLGTQYTPRLRITFEVLETFRGSPVSRVGERVTVAAAEWSPGFLPGHTYVVFATAGAPEGGLVTTVNSHDHEVKDEAHDEDLAWLRGYATSDGSGYLFGES